MKLEATVATVDLFFSLCFFNARCLCTDLVVKPQSIFGTVPKSRLYIKKRKAIITFLAVSVLQAKAGFVSLCYFGAVQTEQVVVGENLHAVVMSGMEESHVYKTSYK